MTRNFISLRGQDPQFVANLGRRALELKHGGVTEALRGKLLAMIFLNPSLRTRVSFAAAMNRFGGQAIELAPGQGSWDLEFRLDAPMDGTKPEHVKDAARVLSRYVDCIGIRSFAGMRSLQEDLAEEMLTAFETYATKPIVNLESAMEHPCQAVADTVTIAERQNNPGSGALPQKFKRMVVMWAPHIKPLPLAVPHSAILAGAYSGLDVCVCHPAGYEVADSFLSEAERVCGHFGKKVQVTQARELMDGDVVYAKSWGAPRLYGDLQKQQQEFSQYRNFLLQPSELPRHSMLMHCLPVRRDVEVSGAALDSEQSVIIDQAENRLWAQAAILEWILSEGV